MSEHPRRVAPVKILQITSYPPPRAGWGVRVSFLKRQLEAEGHVCVVLNTGTSRTIPSPEYETVMGGLDYVRKVFRFSRQGFLVHMHTNGESPKGFVLWALAAGINLLFGKRYVVTFHAGVEQPYFPKSKAPLLTPMYQALFTLADLIVCNSQAVKDRIADYGVNPDKIVPIGAFSRQYLEFERVTLRPEIERFYANYPHVVFTYIRIREGFYLDTLLDAFARVAQARPDVGLLFLGVSADIDPVLWKDVEDRIARYDLSARICVVDDLDHDHFLTALTRSSMYVRTPTTDGVASSVLESLALGIPVVGSENGTRPAGVIRYAASDAGDLAARVLGVLANRAAIVASLPRPEIRDTVRDEVDALLTPAPFVRNRRPATRPTDRATART